MSIIRGEITSPSEFFTLKDSSLKYLVAPWFNPSFFGLLIALSPNSNYLAGNGILNP